VTPEMVSTSASGLDAILARHAPRGHAGFLTSEALRSLAREGSTPVRAVVVVGDLRMSGLLLRESVSPSLYARFLVGFTEAVRGLAGDLGAWFDKFTGDGFVVFWLCPEGEEYPLETVPLFCRSVLPSSEVLVANLKRTSRNFPVGVGLALGLDAGPCELVQIGEAITLVGSPIVGATRMVAGAHAGEAVVNIGLGNSLETDLDRLQSAGIVFERTVVRTKEFPDGQEAFRMGFPRPHAPRRSDPGVGAAADTLVE
jgi:class 3 adenylate cyclase